VCELKTTNPLSLLNQPPSTGTRQHRQVGSLHGRTQIAYGGRLPNAVAGRSIHGSESFLLIAIHVAGIRVTSFLCCVGKGAEQRIISTSPGDLLRA